MEKLYMDNGLLVWNGNGFNGNVAIQKFYREVPTTEHILTTIDAQPIIDQSAGSETFLIQTSGTVKIDGKRSKAFQQTFTITQFQSKYKIVTDCFRLQDGICGEIKLN
jgi:NTF2-related export protein 1/2